VNEKLLTHYRGRLTAEQVADGVNAAKQNARRLHADAELLFEGMDGQHVIAPARKKSASRSEPHKSLRLVRRNRWRPRISSAIPFHHYHR
jgi:hypothetical protein